MNKGCIDLKFHDVSIISRGDYYDQNRIIKTGPNVEKVILNVSSNFTEEYDFGIEFIYSKN